MTDLVNPAATGGFDFGAILDKTLGTYQAISVARLDRDTARYNAAGAAQFAALHNSESPTMLDAWNAQAQAGGVNRVTTGGGSGSAAIPHGLLYMGLGIVGAVLLWKAVK